MDMKGGDNAKKFFFLGGQECLWIILKKCKDVASKDTVLGVRGQKMGKFIILPKCINT